MHDPVILDRKNPIERPSSRFNSENERHDASFMSFRLVLEVGPRPRHQRSSRGVSRSHLSARNPRGMKGLKSANHSSGGLHLRPKDVA